MSSVGEKGNRKPARMIPARINSFGLAFGRGLPLLIYRNISFEIALIPIIIFNGDEVDIHAFLRILATESAVPA